MAPQPTGTVTLLFSDVEGSTALLERLGPARFAEAVDLHRRLLREAFDAHDGYEVDAEGDAFFVAFAKTADAVAAAVDAQRALEAATLPDGSTLRVRMGIHTGEPLVIDGRYVGMDVHRAARIMAAAHGGQVVVSATTHALLDGSGTPDLRDLGPHRLKDLLSPISLYQLEIDGLPNDFPSLRTLYRSNLPEAPWPLLGREAELGEIRQLVAAGTRLITLTGPGGTGKTRLALQAAAELSDDFADGVYFVPLAALRDLDGVRPAVADAIGLRPDEDASAWLRSKKALLVLDNLEQLAGVGSEVAPLLTGQGCVIATSRAPIRVHAEYELPVAPLDDDAATQLFVSRAYAAGRGVEADETVVAICRRLDNLPLAIELAAARSKMLPPTSLLRRLDSALPLLAGGAADAPERQRTLRATIEWSHDLLDADSQTAFRRLSVFRGTFTLEAAEAVAAAGIDTIDALVDQSLVVARPDGRFHVLETIREFARERLDGAGETTDYALRHARYFLGELARLEPVRQTERATEVIAWYRSEEENLRTMLDRLADVSPGEAARAAHLLVPYAKRWGAPAEWRSRLRALLGDPRLGVDERAMVLARLAALEDRLGNAGPATEAATEAARLSEGRGDPHVHFDAIGWLALFASRRGDVETSIQLGRQGLAEAEALGTDARIWATYDLGSHLGRAGRLDEARSLLQQAATEAAAIGHVGHETYALYNLGDLELRAYNDEGARVALERSLARNELLGDTGIAAWSRLGLALALIGLDRRAEARRVLAETLDLLLGGPDPIPGDVCSAISVVAYSAEAPDARVGARLLGAASAIIDERSTELDAMVAPQARRFEGRLIALLGQDAWRDEQAAGRAMALDAAVTAARSVLGAAPQT